MSTDADSRGLSATERDEPPSTGVPGRAEPATGSSGPRVVGLDLSLTSTGIAVIEDGLAKIRTVTSAGRRNPTVPQTVHRLERIVAEIGTIVGLAADLVVIESPSFNSRFGAQLERGALWWMVAGSLVRRRIPVATVTPNGRAKYATGKGNAGKDEVLAAVIRRHPQVAVTGNDTADALVLALMGCRWLGIPQDDVPKAHIAAMAGACWPETIGAVR